jgi:gas vesicle protein
MLLVTNVVKAINKEKRNERAKDLALSAVLGAAAGAVTALFIAPKSINVSLDTLKEKVVETVEKGKKEVDGLVKEGKDKFGVGKDKLESVRNDIMHGKDSVLDTTETIIDDLKG